MNIRRENAKMVGKLAVITVGMFAFGYALIPIYKHICEMTGINILSLSERQVPGNGVAGKDVKVPANTQVDTSRTITVEFDANARGPWDFKPAQRSVKVHPGELTTVMYEFQNVQNRRMAAQAIPSYAPRQAEVGQQLWQKPELGYLEHASSALLQKELQQTGFHIQANVAGMPTAFVASFRNGSKGPVIGLLAEMDALPGMAQAATPVRGVIAGGLLGAVLGFGGSFAWKTRPVTSRLSSLTSQVATGAIHFGLRVSLSSSV